MLFLQTAAFTSALWNVDTVPAVVPSSNVFCTVYEIGGSLTSVLSTTCSKQLPLIPHVGIRIHGREYFYSDHIESRPIDVMAQMLGSFPQVTFDLGPPTVTEAELDAWLQTPDLVSDWQPENYNVFDHNCNHFAAVMCVRSCLCLCISRMRRVATDPLDDTLMRPVLAVTEEMLSELPDWRRTLGLNLMNQRVRVRSSLTAPPQGHAPRRCLLGPRHEAQEGGARRLIIINRKEGLG